MKFEEWVLTEATYAGNMDVMKNLDSAVDSMEKTIKILKKEAETFYNDGDNYRGNIRFDAANRLVGDLNRMVIARDYIKLALKK